VEENKSIKIIDFGFGSSTTQTKLLNFFCGTPSYMPPEIVQKKEYTGFPADIWSLGILMFTLLCGAFPFRATNEKDLYSKIIKGVYSFPEHVSSSACDLIRRILGLDPSTRPSADSILRDVWFNNLNIISEEEFVYSNTEIDKEEIAETVPILTPSSTVPKINTEI